MSKVFLLNDHNNQSFACKVLLTVTCSNLLMTWLSLHLPYHHLFRFWTNNSKFFIFRFAGWMFTSPCGKPWESGKLSSILIISVITPPPFFPLYMWTLRFFKYISYKWLLEKFSYPGQFMPNQDMLVYKKCNSEIMKEFESFLKLPSFWIKSMAHHRYFPSSSPCASSLISRVRLIMLANFFSVFCSSFTFFKFVLCQLLIPTVRYQRSTAYSTFSLRLHEARGADEVPKSSGKDCPHLLIPYRTKLRYM